jgi:hypothetical protein
MLRESVDVGVPELLAGLQIGRAIEDGKHFFRQFVAWVFAAHEAILTPFVSGCPGGTANYVAIYVPDLYSPGTVLCSRPESGQLRGFECPGYSRPSVGYSV